MDPWKIFWIDFERRFRDLSMDLVGFLSGLIWTVFARISVGFFSKDLIQVKRFLRQIHLKSFETPKDHKDKCRLPRKILQDRYRKPPAEGEVILKFSCWVDRFLYGRRKIITCTGNDYFRNGSGPIDSGNDRNFLFFFSFFYVYWFTLRYTRCYVNVKLSVSWG